MRLATGLAALLLALAVPARAQEIPAPVPLPPPERLLHTLQAPHPRLLADTARFAELRRQVTRDELLRSWFATLEEAGKLLLSHPPSSYEIPDGLRLLETSRRVLERAYKLGMLWRLRGDKRYRDRLWKELAAAAAFPDWNPRHFLDTAEMTHAFAIAYDWCYDAWDESERQTIAKAIREKGLEPALAAYRGDPPAWWTRATHNWNQVCNGGIAIGALAIAETEPEMAAQLLHEALSRLPRAMERYAPDGAWDEGPAYWTYATTYNTILLAALETALGTSFGLSEIPGFAPTGTYPIYLTGPTSKPFNFADADERTIRAPALFWLARRFGLPLLAAYQCRVATGHPLDLLWYEPSGAVPEPAPLDAYFRRVEVVTMRSAWTDPKSLFVALKGGDNQTNHGHLDLGSFVLDALGERWALDLGADDYNLPGYWSRDESGARWTYYRLRAEGHNTLVIDPGSLADQNPLAKAGIIKYSSTRERALAAVDLTEAYAPRAERVWRGVSLVERRRVLVQDEIEAASPHDVWWFLHTAARIELSDTGREALLVQAEKRLRARILEPTGVRFQVQAARPLPTSPDPAGQRRNEKISKLAIHIPGATTVRLLVEMVALDGEGVDPGALDTRPLADW
ncbi:MAG: heparinase II/III family protein [Planctomycetota bacterium]